MKYFTYTIQILLGLIFTIFGLNYWLKFIPVPPPSGDAAVFMGVLHGSGYLAVIKGIEIMGGLLTLSGRLTPIGLLFLGPVIVNIVLYDLLLSKAFNPLGIAVAAMSVYLLWATRDRFLFLATGHRHDNNSPVLQTDRS